MPDHLSPKQVARAIGVSESSLKRWVDQGLIQAVRTAGGHRKLALEDVLKFLRENDHPIIAPELLQLPAASPQSEIGLRRGSERLLEALLAGNEELARQVVFDLYLAKHSVATIFDQVFANALRSIGDKWSCQEIDVYQERRSCEIALRVLYELRRAIPQPDSRCSAIGGTMHGDQTTIPTIMAELVLRDAGWQAMSLGTSLPTESLIKAMNESHAQLFWLSATHIHDEATFVQDFAKISAAATRCGMALVVGGRALNETLRRELSYSAFCDTMQHLDTFARTLLRASASSDQPHARDGFNRNV